ncbi:hypothetical protein [Roseateles sp.]|jgi:hypothetical protein|uniref:hypothetical protein n=1 Tax=Roseateles sp. TaxID=1971397 RepID=UPI003BA8EB1F
MPHAFDFVDADADPGTSGGIYAGSWCAWRRFDWREMGRWTVSFHLPNAEPYGDWMFPFGEIFGGQSFVAVTDDFGTLVGVPK